MIFAKGNLKPTSEQLAHALKHADESFCATSSEPFNRITPVPEGFEITGNGILLRLRNVEPHDDPWVGNGNEPRRGHRRALFWLMDVSRPRVSKPSFSQLRMSDLWFGCGKEQIRMKVGDWVLFDDSKVHFVMSDHIWRGASWQLRKVP